MKKFKGSPLGALVDSNYKYAKYAWGNENNISAETLKHIDPQKEDKENFNEILASYIQGDLLEIMGNRDPGDKAKEEFIISFFANSKFWKIISL